MNNVRVGIGVMVIKDGKFLAGIRKGSHGAGLYSFPGGHLDWRETWEDCTYREVAEECGEEFKIKIRPFATNKLEFFVTNDIMPDENKHYVTIFICADWIGGEPQNMEPHKCEGWEWKTFEQLKFCCSNVHWLPINLIEHHIHKIVPNEDI